MTASQEEEPASSIVDFHEQSHSSSSSSSGSSSSFSSTFVKVTRTSNHNKVELLQDHKLRESSLLMISSHQVESKNSSYDDTSKVISEYHSSNPVKPETDIAIPVKRPNSSSSDRRSRFYQYDTRINQHISFSRGRYSNRDRSPSYSPPASKRSKRTKRSRSYSKDKSPDRKKYSRHEEYHNDKGQSERKRQKTENKDGDYDYSTASSSHFDNDHHDDRSHHRYRSSYYSTKRFRRRNPKYSFLPIEWWDRTDECKDAKSDHVARVDELCDYSREQLVLDTTLWKEDPALEPNMFPYLTPKEILHYTLWSKYEMTKEEIIHFVDKWLEKHMPEVRRWNYDDNLGERSIELFHVHVYIETIPFSFTAEEGQEYLPPHLSQHSSN